MMDQQTVLVVGRLLCATLAGGTIGLERTVHGRAAGFRTHALVCTASALLLQLTIYQLNLLPMVPREAIRLDPLRMAQGIMTGIGFLGAGVIMREGLTIRGLTTAASLWITAAIGIVIGMGFYLPAVAATLLVLGILAIFRWVEKIIPREFYGQLTVTCRTDRDFGEEELVAFLNRRGLKVANASYGLQGEERLLEYRLAIHARNRQDFSLLARDLPQLEAVAGFNITPAGH